jgi:hypothetical protein
MPVSMRSYFNGAVKSIRAEGFTVTHTFTLKLCVCDSRSSYGRETRSGGTKRCSLKRGRMAVLLLPNETQKPGQLVILDKA